MDPLPPRRMASRRRRRQVGELSFLRLFTRKTNTFSEFSQSAQITVDSYFNYIYYSAQLMLFDIFRFAIFAKDGNLFEREVEKMYSIILALPLTGIVLRRVPKLHRMSNNSHAKPLREPPVHALGQTLKRICEIGSKPFDSVDYHVPYLTNTYYGFARTPAQPRFSRSARQHCRCWAPLDPCSHSLIEDVPCHYLPNVCSHPLLH
jgi:hypothetical protein